MAKFVPDVKTNRWVIISPTRISRPHDNPVMPNQAICPFCPAQDSLNTELFRIGDPWKVRVIANKYPLTDIHEVIIHSPDHLKDIPSLPVDQVKLILTTYRARFNFHQADGQVLIFNNHDIHAGASLSHPHSQIVVVPRQINLDTIPKEPIQNEVVKTKHFVAYCPDFSQWPYEIWIAPNETIDDRKSKMVVEDRGSKIENKNLSSNFNSQDTTFYRPSSTVFGDITDDQIADLASLLQKILAFIHAKFTGGKAAMKQPMDLADETGDVPYNYYLYHGPDWYLRIIPRLIHRAGFELGTGLSVNIVDPAEAAKEYRAGISNF